MTRFGLTIFLSAFLLFLVQPILGRYIVPWFGGSMSVWTTCMLFFQVMLLAGYSYAHLLGTKLAPHRQLAVHVALLGASMLLLPIGPGAAWRPDDAQSPTLRILLLLLAQIGLPFLLLAATGPLLQSWFGRVFPGRSPYRLYALSNLGSLLALLGYPFAIEAHLTLRMQGWVWAAGYAVFACACCLAAWRVGRAGAPREPAPATPGDGVAGAAPAALWVGLAAIGSVMLLATTNVLCQGLAVTPMLWVLPLAIYLATFVLCFDRDRWYDRRVFVPLLALAACTAVVLPRALEQVAIWTQVAVHGAALFAACMVCHGELARARPAPRHLTAFYLAVALGGALGGAFCALIVPLVFADYWEYQLGLLAALVLAVARTGRDLRARWDRVRARRIGVAAYVALLALGVGLTVQVVEARRAFVSTSRSFYGVLRVQLARDAFERPVAEMVHGRTTHGTQFYDEDRRAWPTTYYGHEGGVGVAVRALRRAAGGEEARPLRIGVVGLGVGTVAALAGPGDYLRFYEINPEVERLAREHFWYLARTAADVDVVLGDARIVMHDELERGERQAFDLLVVDAFNDDAIPIHLLTREALQVYEEHLAPGRGVLAFHLSNRHLDLVPVVRGLARAGGHEMRLVISPDERERAGTFKALWALVTGNAALLRERRVRLASEEPADVDGAEILWTDDFASLLPVVQLGEGRVGRWEHAPHQGRFVVDSAALLARPEQDRLLWRMRGLYADTGGRSPMALVTTAHVPPGFEGEDGVQRYRRKLFGRLGMDRPGGHGVMLLFSSAAGASRVTLELGDGWDEAGRALLRQALLDAVTDEANRGSLQRAVLAAVEGIERAVRRHHAGTDGTPSGPAPR